MFVVGPNKKQLQFASYYCKNIVKLKLRWSYSSFKLISIGFKQNLGLGCSNFYFRGLKWKKKLKIYIKILFGPGQEGSFEPPGLNVTPPMIIIIIITSYYLLYKENNGSNVLSPIIITFKLLISLRTLNVMVTLQV
mgnify:CR=1 FL=1